MLARPRDLGRSQKTLGRHSGHTHDTGGVLLLTALESSFFLLAKPRYAFRILGPILPPVPNPNPAGPGFVGFAINIEVTFPRNGQASIGIDLALAHLGLKREDDEWQP